MRVRIRVQVGAGTGGGGDVIPHPYTGGARAHEDVDSLAEKAKRLSSRERRELLDLLALDNQISRASSRSRDLDMWAEAVLTALEDAIGSGNEQNYGLVLVKRTVGSSSNWRPVESFMRSSRLQELPSQERLSVYYMLARLLVDHARGISKRSGAPLSLKMIGNCSGEIAGVFDSSFPGYLASGLAPVVAKQLLAGGHA